MLDLQTKLRVKNDAQQFVRSWHKTMTTDSIEAMVEAVSISDHRQVNTWKLRRCRIPHSIIATADLVDAILHHDTSKNSISTIKAVYASALSKTITALCDLEQDSAEKRSMAEQAVKLSMPEEWVFLRHAITHGSMPPLKPLESAVKEAVLWLWGHFWAGIDGVEDEMGIEELRGQMQGVLEAWRTSRRKTIVAKGKGDDVSVDSGVLGQTGKTIKRLCKRRRDGLDQLVHVLLRDHIILPSEKQYVYPYKKLQKGLS